MTLIPSNEVTAFNVINEGDIGEISHQVDKSLIEAVKIVPVEVVLVDFATVYINPP